MNVTSKKQMLGKPMLTQFMLKELSQKKLQNRKLKREIMPIDFNKLQKDLFNDIYFN